MVPGGMVPESVVVWFQGSMVPEGAMVPNKGGMVPAGAMVPGGYGSGGLWSGGCSISYLSPVLTSSVCHGSRRYASYWNAFLFQIYHQIFYLFYFTVNYYFEISK